MATLQFLGAAGTVTGSKFLLEHEGHRLMIDCGLFQGLKENRLRNWQPFPLPPNSISAVILTHAHIDHSGGLPRLVREGFSGPVFSTPGTSDLCGLLLPDSAQLQEEEARFANQKHYSKHAPALPLYTQEDASAALRLFETFGYHREKEILPGITLQFFRAGHILGSAICVVTLRSTRQRIVFSGDLGRFDAPILRDPELIDAATTLLIESTYGNRSHEANSPSANLAQVVRDTVKKNGVLVIPAFAVGRTQEILYYLRELEEANQIPELPVFVDSPMACDATPLYLAHTSDHDLDMRKASASGSPLATSKTHFVRSRQQSQDINSAKGPAIIISASGMATGGRILHHLKHRLPKPENTILFVGYQAVGTRGRRLLEGERSIKIHGEMVPVEAEIRQLSGFSAHADNHEALRWLQGFSHTPKQTLLVHGEPDALLAQKQQVEGLGWAAYIPKHMETLTLVQP